jgi:exopolyphosphatase/guanosine-5'-triphosphate,3'-diphosphate pyrophosphatase
MLLEKYEEEPEHVRRVAVLADQLFAALAPWHRRDGDGEERLLLRLAALLHDIGWSKVPTGKGHHKESARLIHDHAWKQLSPAQVAVVAQTARYHRKKLPAADHPAYQALPAADRKTVDLLAGILRVADALDRSHAARIREVSARIGPGEIALVVTPVPDGDWEAERRTVERKKDLLERTSGRTVVVTGEDEV